MEEAGVYVFKYSGGYFLVAYGDKQRQRLTEGTLDEIAEEIEFLKIPIEKLQNKLPEEYEGKGFDELSKKEISELKKLLSKISSN